MPRQCPCFNAAALVQFSQMGDRLLNNPTANPHAANQAPIAVNLPVLPANRVAQIHAPKQIRLVASGKHPRSSLHGKIAFHSHSSP